MLFGVMVSVKVDARAVVVTRTATNAAMRTPDIAAAIPHVFFLEPCPPFLPLPDVRPALALLLPGSETPPGAAAAVNTETVAASNTVSHDFLEALFAFIFFTFFFPFSINLILEAQDQKELIKHCALTRSRRSKSAA